MAFGKPARCFLIGALAFLPPFDSGAFALEITPADEEKLGAGEVVAQVSPDPAGTAASVSAAIDIQASPEAVWSVMVDCARAPKFVPDLKSCRVLQSDPQGAWDVREHMIDWAWFLPTIRNVFRSEYERPHRLTFHRVDGDLKESDGEWRLEPRNNGSATRVFYTARLAPNGWIPTSWVEDNLRRDIPKVLTALRRECSPIAPR